MSKFISGLIALIVLVAAIVIIAPNLIPADAYKGRIEAAASSAVGREVTIGDDISFKLFPQTAFAVSDLHIANEAGFKNERLATVGKADIGVRLMSLLSERVEVERFNLADADINLEKSATGDVNWILGNANASSEGGDRGAVGDISLGEVKISRSRVTYSDDKSGKTYVAEDIEARMRLNSLSEPLEFNGAMNFQGASSTVAAVLTSPADLLDKRPANLKMDMKIGDAIIGADLTLTASDSGSGFSGPVNLDAPDLPALASLFDVRLEDAPGFDRLKFSGQADGAAKSVTLRTAKIEFDDIDAEGELTLDWSEAKPKTTGALAVGALDLRPYLPPPTQSAGGFPAWSDAPLNFSSLRNMDADLEIRADQIFLNEIEVGESRMRLAITNGRLTADISQLGLYGGGGSGRLTVDASRTTPAIIGNFSLNSVEAEPFSAALLKNDRLLGLGGFNLQFSASGASQSAIMSTLDGKGGFDLNDGAIKGVNIVKLASAVAKLYEGGLTNPTSLASAIAEAQRPDEQTDFSKMLSQFTIENGLVQAPTINMEGPFLTMTGAGKIDLPGQALDLRLLPRASTTADNSSGKMVAIPVRVSGTFSKPVIAVDVEALLRGKAESTLKNLLNDALNPKDAEADADQNGAQKEDPAKTILKGILGGGTKSDQQTEKTSGQTEELATEDPTAAIVGGAINQLFGTRKPADAAKNPDSVDESESAPNP